MGGRPGKPGNTASNDARGAVGNYVIAANRKPATEKDSFAPLWQKYRHLGGKSTFIFPQMYPSIPLQGKPGSRVSREPSDFPVSSLPSGSRFDSHAQRPPGGCQWTALPMCLAPPLHYGPRDQRDGPPGSSKQTAAAHGPKAALCRPAHSQGEGARPSPVLFLNECTDLGFSSFLSRLLMGMEQSQVRELTA